MRAINPAFIGSQGSTIIVNIGPPSAFGYATLGYGTTTAITNNVTATASGGAAPYTYSWEYVSGDAEPTLNVLSSGTACWFWASFIAGTKSALWKCVVTDSLGSTGESLPFTVDLEISS